MSGNVIAFGARATDRPTQYTRAYIESMMPAVLEALGEDTVKRHLFTLAGVEGELFGRTPVTSQVMRVDEALTAYASNRERGGSPNSETTTTFVDIVSCDKDMIILAMTDLQDGASVIAPMPLRMAAQFAMSILEQIQKTVMEGSIDGTQQEESNIQG